jgi:hypothetical protein
MPHIDGSDALQTTPIEKIVTASSTYELVKVISIGAAIYASW